MMQQLAEAFGTVAPTDNSFGRMDFVGLEMINGEQKIVMMNYVYNDFGVIEPMRVYFDPSELDEMIAITKKDLEEESR